MSKRFTDTEKWKDPWFIDLSLDGKTLFCFLCDQCNIAGFYERHDKLTSFYTNIEIDKLPEVYEEISKSIVIRGRWVFVKNFIRHQKNLPLNPMNNCHKAIIEELESKSGLFSDVYKELNLELYRGHKAPLKPLIRGLGKGKGKGKGKESLDTATELPKQPQEPTDIQKIVKGFKVLQGYPKDDKAWDKINFRRFSKPAKELLEFFGDWGEAVDCMQDIYQRLTGKGLTVTLETVVKHATDWKKDKQERRPDGILPR